MQSHAELGLPEPEPGMLDRVRDWAGQYVPVPAEADAINFVTRMNTPTLMLSGRYDYNFPDDTSSRPFFDLLGTPAAEKRRVVYDTGHNLPFADAIKQTLDWFDRYLGPVAR